MTYAEKLKDPRWQKKRLLIFERDNFKCTFCGDEKTTLHIHHDKYSGEPWEVDNLHLHTVCEDCHSLLEWLKINDKDNKPFLIFKSKEDLNTLLICDCLSGKVIIFIKQGQEIKPIYNLFTDAPAYKIFMTL